MYAKPRAGVLLNRYKTLFTMAKTDFKSVDEYIATFDKADQASLNKIREAIRKAAPAAEEVISYQIPAYKNGKSYAIYFSGFKEHFSLAFPPPFTVFDVFAKELAPYKQSKSVVQLPKSAPLPLDLIARMVKFRLEEAAAGAQAAPGRKPAAAKTRTAGTKATAQVGKKNAALPSRTKPVATAKKAAASAVKGTSATKSKG